MNLDEIKKRAKRKNALLKKKKEDPRYRAVLGRMVKEHFLIAPNIPPNRAHPTVDDALWVGTIEPRVLELLPAVILRRPKIFMQAKELPDDLKAVVRELRRGTPRTAFRGIPPEKYAAWEETVRASGPKKTAVAKLYRFHEDDLALLNKLKKRWKITETETIRRALQYFEKLN